MELGRVGFREWLGSKEGRYLTEKSHACLDGVVAGVWGTVIVVTEHGVC